MWMWGASVGVYQLLNWKMHGETLKLETSSYSVNMSQNITLSIIFERSFF